MNILRNMIVVALVGAMALVGGYAQERTPMPEPGSGNMAGTPERSALWKDFVEARSDGREPILPDFSYAGYAYCERPIPDVEGPIFDVTDYGAIPDDGVTDEAGIQAAIDAAEARGGGVVFFPPGRFDLGVTEEVRNTIVFVNAGDIVLRGSGSGEDGTELFMHQSIHAPANGEKWKIQVRPTKTEPESIRIAAITADVPRESYRVPVSDPSALSAGDHILIHMPENHDPAVKNAYLAPYKALPAWDRPIWFKEFHEIAAVEGDELVLREPVHIDIRVADGWEVLSYPDEHLSEVGVEDIRFRANWHRQPFDHGGYTDKENGHNMLFFRHVVNGWTRRCEFHDTYNTLKYELSARISLLQTDYYGAGGHKAMALETCWGVLMGIGRSHAPHYHVPSYDDSTTGFVLWRFDYSGCSYDCHGEWVTANLNDASRGHFIKGRMGTGRGDLPNHLRHLVFWNFEHTGPANSFDWWRGNHEWQSVVKPVMVGVHGNPISFDRDQLQIEESHGTPVEPLSLFEAQLCLRLGAVPKWLTDLAAGENIPGPR